MKLRFWVALGATLFFSVACTREVPLGSSERPIQIGLIPGQNPKTLEVNGRQLADFMEAQIGLKFQVHVPVTFIAVVEALGTKRIDMAMMNTFGYLLAHERHGARVRLIGLFKGTDQYYGQIISHVDGPKTLEEINGKKFAFVDPASTSGHLMATRLFREKQIKPKDVVFAGRHDTVALMVYQKRVDAGATYHALPDNGEPQDARKLIKPQHPDVFEKVRILAKTGPIPNDPIVFRKDFPIDLQEKIVVALKAYAKTPEGLKVLDDLYHMSDFRDATDADYDSVRSMLLEAGKSPSDYIK